MSNRRMDLRHPDGEPQQRTAPGQPITPIQWSVCGYSIPAEEELSLFVVLLQKAEACPYLTYVSRIETILWFPTLRRRFKYILEKGHAQLANYCYNLDLSFKCCTPRVHPPKKLR